MSNQSNRSKETVYIKTDEHNLVYSLGVNIGDVFKIEGTNDSLVNQIKKSKMYQYSQDVEQGSGKRNVVIFSILKIVELIHTVSPDVEVVNLGPADFVVEYIPSKQQPKWIEILKLVSICLITFFGAAFTIMAFNNDISISGVFERYYMQVIGTQKPAVSEIEVFYSIGLTLGIMIFFNHVGKKKITMDATPIQVELRKYESDMNDTLIENASRKGHCEDVE